MRFLGYEGKIVRLLEALYKDTISAVYGLMETCQNDL